MYVLRNERKEYFKHHKGGYESLVIEIERSSMYLSRHQAVIARDKLNKHKELGKFKLVEIEVREK
jgi:hypothetical protein